MQFVVTSAITGITKTTQYSSPQYPELKAIASTSLGFSPLKICISIPSHTLTVQQKGGLWHSLLHFFPLVSTDRLFPLVLSKNGEPIGSSELLSGDPATYFHIAASCFELRGHTGCKYSICKDGVQVALVQKKQYSYAEENSYLVSTSVSDSDDIAYLFMLCAYIDRREHRRSDSTFTVVRWEKSFVYHDPYKERAEWTPEIES